MSYLSLLPAADEAPRCAAFTRQLGVAPFGTAIRADMMILIEAPLPWPMPVKAHPFLDGLMELLEDAPAPARILAVVPTTNDGTVRVRCFTRDGASARRRVFELSGPSQLRALVTALLAGEHPVEHAADEPVPPDHTVLICTQGSHDLCCGSAGTRLAIEATAHYGAINGDVEVLRVSHTGGHRFAPTGMTLPDGRMWAELSMDLLINWFDRAGEPADYAPLCRGWWGADKGFAQTAEISVFAAGGWSESDLPRTIETVERSDVSADVTVTVGEQQHRLAVEVTREVPTISCASPGGLPAKPGREYGVVSSAQS